MIREMEPMGRAILDYVKRQGRAFDDIGYCGELSFRMQYKDTIGEPFDWLYIDAETLKQVAETNGYRVEVVAEGEHYDYLARITRKL